jgi:putative drug exporter of the RND superfamily
MTWPQRESQGTPSRHLAHPPEPSAVPSGPVGRLAGWACGHFRVVVAGWVILGIALGAFAPRVFDVLAGAGWQANGSESVRVRELTQEHFRGMGAYTIQVVVRSDTLAVSDPTFQRVIDDAGMILESDGRTTEVTLPQPGVTVSKDSHTAVLTAGAGTPPQDMVRAVDDLKGPLRNLSTPDIHVYPTGAPALWSDFNESNRKALIKAELASWPVILTIIIIAFGSLVAAGLPLLLIIASLGATAGILVLLNEVTPVSIWAINFALILALALGTSYALFIVTRFRGALRRGGSVTGAIIEAMDTAGKAVLFSGGIALVTVLALLPVPVPAFRTMALGMTLSVIFVLLGTLTLLPAVLGKLGGRVNALAPPLTGKGKGGSYRLERWANLLWRQPIRYAVISLTVLVGLSAPFVGLRISMPSIAVIPADAGARQGYEAIQNAMGPGAPAVLQILVPAADAERAADAAKQTKGVAAVVTAQLSPSERFGLIQAVPQADPSDQAVADTLRRLRAELPPQALVGGFAAENIDLQLTLRAYQPMVVVLPLTIGFLILLVALQAPLVALFGTVTSLLSIGAAFGTARLIFQNGFLSGLLGFTAQGFLDDWTPALFFVISFGVTMTYTFFLLSTAKEHYEHTGNPATAIIGSITHSGRMILAATTVISAVFFTFVLTEPLPLKEMGLTLGSAVLLDAGLVRLMLLPAMMGIIGQAAWWSPAWLQLPRLKPSRVVDAIPGSPQ